MTWKRKIKKYLKHKIFRLMPGIDVVFKLNDPAVFLTFDDGPDPGVTPKLLDLLEQEGISASFFLLGQKARKYPDITRSIVEHGHTIGNHSYSHNHLNENNINTLVKEINLTKKIIDKYSGSTCRLFRPPYGEYNYAQLSWLKRNRFKTILWSVDPVPEFPDYKNNISLLAENILPGDIVLLHDDDNEIIELVSRLVRVLKEKGMSFSKISD